MEFKPGQVVKDKMQIPRPGQRQDIGRIVSVDEDKVIVQWQDGVQRAGDLALHAAETILEEVNAGKYCEICAAETEFRLGCSRCGRMICPRCEAAGDEGDDEIICELCF